MNKIENRVILIYILLTLILIVSGCSGRNQSGSIANDDSSY